MQKVRGSNPLSFTAFSDFCSVIKAGRCRIHSCRRWRDRSRNAGSSEAMAKYAAEIHAAAPNVVAVALEPTVNSAIDGTQINTRNSSTSQLRREWWRYLSPSGSNSPTRSA
jgi:hypothetical protein